LHEEERILGNEFEVNLSVGFEPSQLPVTKFEQTIDYTLLYQHVKQRMSVPTPLLETLATVIAAEIQSRYSQVTKISIRIKKLYPPVNNFEGSLGVSFEWNK
jgi:7,8-dihydroneopterin aldolase/epimerase/oxygenase